MGAPVGASIFSQMFALALASSAVALLLNLVLQSLVPLRPLATRTASEIALGVQQEAEWLIRRSVPAGESGDAEENPAARAVAARIARYLRIPAERVNVELSRAQGHRTVLLHDVSRTPELAVVGDFRLWVRQADGSSIVYEPVNPGFLDNRLRRNLALLLICALVMLPVAWLVARWLALPFKEFAQAAERLGRDPGAAPQAIAGPAEANRALASLTLMQQRLDSYVTDRTRMLAAIAHDLRTPLTRLAFRIESVDPPLSDAMARDVEEMQHMLAETMRFARADALSGPRELLDMSEIGAEVAEDLALTRDGIAFHPAPLPLPVSVDRIAIRRLLANLTENALAYGGNARISAHASEDGDNAVIDVDDDGPCIPPADIERLFEPFQRLESSRSRHTGGIGLGLPIARSVARAHGGDVVLMNRDSGGVRARIILPLERVDGH